MRRIDPFLHPEAVVGLRRQAVRGGAATVLGDGVRLVLSIAGTAVLTRLLLPSEFGLVAMVRAFTGFVTVFRDLGLTTATIQSKTISREQVSTIFWINVLLSVALMGLIAASAPLIAWFYNDPRALRITFAVSVPVLIGGLGAQHVALLRRQMLFGTVMVILVTSTACSLAAAIAAAWFGAGYWALVVQFVMVDLSITLGAWIACPWLPGPPVRRSGVRGMLRFGGFLSASKTMTYALRNVDNILIGRYVGTEALGLYSRAYALMIVPIQRINGPMTSVALPALSRLQDQPERFRRFYCRAIELIAAFSFPLVIFLLIEAHDVILLVLGPKWVDATAVFQWLAPAALVGTMNVATAWVFLPLGQAGRSFKMSLVSSIITVGSFVVGLQWGMIGVAAAFSISRVLLRPFQILYCFRKTPLTPMHLVRAIGRPLGISAAAAGVCLTMLHALFSSSPGLQLIITGGGYLVFYAGLWLALPSGRRIIFEWVALYKEITTGT